MQTEPVQDRENRSPALRPAESAATVTPGPDMPIGRDADDMSAEVETRYKQMSRDEMRAELQRLGATNAAAGEAARRPEGGPHPYTDDRREEDRTGAAVFGFVGDVVDNVSEIPRQALGGALDAVNAMGEGIRDLAVFMEKHVPLGAIDLDKMEYIPPGDYDPDSEEALVSVPTAAEPRTPTGHVVRSFAQFMTGFIPAVRAFKASAAVSRGGQVARYTGAGAVADFVVFEGQEENLADFAKKVGIPDNAVTDFLATDPDDAEAVARLKNTATGAVAGAVLDGFIEVARFLRHARSGREKTGTKVAVPEREVEGRDFEVMGEPGGELLKVKPKRPDPDEELLKADAEAQKAGIRPETIEAMTSARSVPIGPNTFEINFAAIDTPDDVKKVIEGMAEGFRGTVDEARRGTLGDDAVKEMADRLGMTPDELLRRRQGEAFNAEQILASRELLNASAATLITAAKAARTKPGDEVAAFVFRRALAVHHAVQQQVMGARAEAGRALRAWSIPAGGGRTQATMIMDLVFKTGGTKTASDLADRIVALDAAGASPKAIDQMARKGVVAKSIDVIRTVFINGMLSSQKTHAVNIMSNFGMLAQAIAERGLGAQISKQLGTEGGVAAGEAAQMAFGLIEGMKDGLRFAWKATRTGETGRAVGDKPRASAGKVDDEPRGTVEALVNPREGGPLGRALHLFDVALEVPTRMLGAEDELFKAVNYRMQLRALAARNAAHEGLDGAAAKQRIAEILDDPPDSLKAEAVDFALLQTFTNKTGDIGDAILKLRRIGGSYNPLFFILPFVRTPVNLARQAVERSPFAFLSKQWRDDLAAGGARADMALSRMAAGTTVMLLATDLAMQGRISGNGPKDPGERERLMRTGWRPHSVRIGDEWVAYNRFDPLGMTIGYAANMAETFRTREVDPEASDELDEVLSNFFFAATSAVMSKTYLQGVTEFMAAANDDDRYGSNYVKDMLARFVPYSALMSNMQRAIDPELKDTNSLGEYLESRIVGFGENLPRRRDLWGRPITIESGYGAAYDFVSPVTISSIEPQPIDEELGRLRVFPERLDKRITVHGVDIDLSRWPAVYERYAELAGNGWKNPATGLGLMDHLNAVVTGQSPYSLAYQMRSDGAEGGKAGWIMQQIRLYREMARNEILRDPEFRKFQTFAEARRRERIEQQSGVNLFGGND